MFQRGRQHRYVAAVFLAGLFLAAGGWALLRVAWSPDHARRWALAVVLALPVLIWRLRTAFSKEPEKLPESCYPGLANQLTVFRGLLICLLVGFLFLRAPDGALAWAPCLIFSTALIMDGLDGFLARLRRETSAFGAFLDLDLDALGTLVGILVAVHYARLPDWYILAGIAYYLFSGGKWWRAERGLVLRPLPASRYRRLVAGAQSVFIAVALLPVTTLSISGTTAALVIVPVLAGFLRDWWVVAGYGIRAWSSESPRARRPSR